MELINIDGLNIQYHQKSKRIINVELDDTIIEKLAFNFKKFDILTLEYKPFSRFTIANVLDFDKMQEAMSAPWVVEWVKKHNNTDVVWTIEK